MRYERLFLPLLPVSIFLGGLALVAGACGGGSSSSSGGGGGTANDCYDYTSFDGMTPAVSFKTDVLPIFSRSCALSAVCHGCDTSSNPSCTMSGYKPFLGVPTMGPAASPAQIAAIFASAVGQPASLQTSTVDGSMVGDPDMDIVKAGDPAHSFMMYKLDGDFPTTPDNTEVSCSSLTCASGKTCGQAMPSGGMALPSSDRDTIRRWIAQGAQNN